MFSKYLYVVLFFAFTSTIAASPNNVLGEMKKIEAKVNQVRESNPSLDYIGRHQDKLYFMQNTSVTWSEAREICAASDVAAVQVEFNGEMTYIRSLLDFSSNQYYWTDGQNDQQAYFWYSNHERVTLNTGWNSKDDNCLLIRQSSNFLRFPCNNNDPERPYLTRPLCQFVITS